MMNKMLYVFLGCYAGEDNFQFLTERFLKSRISVSNSEYERAVFTEFSKKHNAIMVAAPNVGRWPFSCKKIYFDGKKTNPSNNVKCCSYFTIFGLSNISKTLSLKRRISFI